MLEAQETLQSLKELYNYDFENVYYQLIRTMMTDLRLQQVAEESENTEITPDVRLIEAESKLELARILLLKENRADLASQIFEDLYMGNHPLAAVWRVDGTIDFDLLNSAQTEQFVPAYFRQRLALTSLQNGQRMSTDQIRATILTTKLSGVSASGVKMEDYDRVYLVFYNMQRLILIYVYH